MTQDMIDEVLCYLREGDSLRTACEKAGTKHSTWLTRCEGDAALADQYAGARALGRALRFERLRDMTAEEPKLDTAGRVDPGWVAWKKLNIDTEKWALSKEEPKKYGDKLALGGDPESPLMVTIRRLTNDTKD